MIMKTLFKTLLATRVSDVTVDPVMNGSDTVMYLVNYPEGGWELLSADKRIPTRLMVGETGSDDILWNLYNTEVVYLDSTYVNHLIPTRWSQDVAYFKWYNRYVPFINNLKIDSTSGRCVTGCVPVACAQVLNYLQPILGFMGTGESHGYVNGISWTEIRGNI